MTGKGNIYVSTCVYLYRAYGSFCDSNINYTYIYIEKEKSHWCGFRRVIFDSRVWWPIRVTSIIIAWMSTKYDFYPSVSMGCPCFGGYVFNHELDLLAWMSILQFLMVLNVLPLLWQAHGFNTLTRSFKEHGTLLTSWWRHQMETFSALLVLCVGNSPVTGEFPSQRPVTRGFDVVFDLSLKNRWVNNRKDGDFGCHRAHYDVIVMFLDCLTCMCHPHIAEYPIYNLQVREI